MTIIFNAEIQIQYFCYFSFGVSILFCLSFLNGLSQTDAVCGISSEIRSSFRISLIFIQICYSKQSYCYKRLSIYLCSRQQIIYISGHSLQIHLGRFWFACTGLHDGVWVGQYASQEQVGGKKMPSVVNPLNICALYQKYSICSLIIAKIKHL